MSVAASLKPTLSQSIDVADETSANRLISVTNWNAAYATGYVLVHNDSDDVCFVSTASTAAATCRGVPAGATASFGPYTRDEAAGLYIWGAGTGNAVVGFDLVVSEGF